MADGVNKIIAVKKETAWGTQASASGAQLLPRVTGGFQLEKDSYDSNLINPSQQVRDSRHGTRKATGTLEGELMGSAYALFMAAALRKDFVGAVTTTALTTIAASATGYTRSTGSYLTDGFKNGMIATVGGFVNAANNGKVLITGVTATVLTARRVDGTTMVTEAAGPSVTIALAGKRTFVPQTGHTDDSFTVEELYQDLSPVVSCITTGQQVNTMDIDASPNSMVKISFGFMGKNANPATNTAYFTSPAAVPSEGTMSSPSGLAVVNGTKTCDLTSFKLSINNNITQESVVFCPDMGAKSRGNVAVTGTFTALFKDITFLNYFDAEQEITLSASWIAQDGDVISVYLPRVKINSSTRDDGQKVIIITCNFTALESYGLVVGEEKTTITIQDTSAP